jgi:hypothetical protein
MFKRKNLNWQDRMLGGAILTGFVVTVVIAAIIVFVTWGHERTADHAQPATTVGSSTDAARGAPSTNK